MQNIYKKKTSLSIEKIVYFVNFRKIQIKFFECKRKILLFLRNSAYISLFFLIILIEYLRLNKFKYLFFIKNIIKGNNKISFNIDLFYYYYCSKYKQELEEINQKLNL